LVSQAEVLARRSSDAPTIGLARMCKAMVRYFAGEFDAVANELAAVEQYLLTHCPQRGLGASHHALVRVLSRCGSRAGCASWANALIATPQTPIAPATATWPPNLRTYQSSSGSSAAIPSGAARDIEVCWILGRRDLYHVQHFFHLYARCEQALYGGRPDQARAAIEAERDRLAGSALLKISGIRIEHAWISGRVALAMAERLPVQERAPLLRQARRHARVLARAEHQTGVAMGALLEAGLCSLQASPSRAATVVALETGRGYR